MFRYAMLCLFLIFFSCEKDEPVDSTPPTISFVSPTSSGAVWNTVKIVLDVQDIALVDVEILIDNVSLATLTALPFEIDWDTQSLPDGPHTIKAIAKDKSGNVNNAEIQVTVKNVLLTIDVPTDFLVSTPQFSQQHFVLISDKDWKPVAFAEVKNGASIKLLATKEFGDDNFKVSEIIIVTKNSFKATNGLTFLNVPRGNWMLFNNNDDNDYVSAGSVSISFSNPLVASPIYYEASTNAGFDFAGTTQASEGNIDARPVDLAKSPSKLFVRQIGNPDGNKYSMYTVSAIAAGGSYKVNLASVNNANPATNTLTKESIVLPSGTEDCTVSLLGLPVANNLTERFNLGRFALDQGTNIEIAYPGTLFPGYYSETSLETNKYSLYARSFAKDSIEPIPAQVTFSNVADKSVTASISGTFDYAAVVFDNDNFIDENTWYVVGPEVTNQFIRIPELPTTISSLVSTPQFNALTLAETIQVADYGSVNGYANFLTEKNKSVEAFARLRDLIPVKSMDLFVANGSGSSGRKSTALKRKRFF